MADVSKKSAEERLLDDGYEDVLILKNYSYDDALIGVSEDNRAVYDFDMMVEWLMKEENMSALEAIEWIEFNTICSLPRGDSEYPIIMYRLRSN